MGTGSCDSILSRRGWTTAKLADNTKRRPQGQRDAVLLLTGAVAVLVKHARGVDLFNKVNGTFPNSIFAANTGNFIQTIPRFAFFSLIHRLTICLH